ncbi:hemicentin-2-like [Pectinophora gossypiella]|uniref:hemicentin-2-like n=1 Tax=Pectinophora gossypiella TaxID=13191 RepID=UPI00214ED3F7|nr:hemicentin-2-like [Pectinophora gossypiella]
MLKYFCCYLAIFVVSKPCLVDGQGVEKKNSLVFVIDDTGSMADDIDEAKKQVDSIFDAALKENDSTIKDFVIVTFNDPDVAHRTTTENRTVFKKALEDITVNGGGDCEEMALTGLKLALENSRDGSIVYLFTDADAKDLDKAETVKKLAKEKQCRLFFMMTGNCNYGVNAPGHRVFFDLAEATQGQVFTLTKKEVGQALHHAVESVRPSDIIASSAFGAAGVVSDIVPASNTINFNVAENVKEVLISVSGVGISVDVTDSAGGKPKTEETAKTSGSTIVKVLDVKPGKYTATVFSAGETSVVITGITKGGESSKIV